MLRFLAMAFRSRTSLPGAAALLLALHLPALNPSGVSAAPAPASEATPSPPAESQADTSGEKPEYLPPDTAKAGTRDSPEPPPLPPRIGWKSDLLAPLLGLFVPGVPQYFQGRPLLGLAYTGTALAGLSLSSQGEKEYKKKWGTKPEFNPLTESPEERKYIVGGLLFQGAEFLSLYQAFRSSVPAYQREDGMYRFLPPPDKGIDLALAPVHFGFLARPTSYIPLGLLASVVTYLVADERDSHAGADWTFSGDDLLFGGALAYNAGVSEEAAFRGWLLPLAYQYTGQRWFLANGLQAGLFAAAHYSEDVRYPVVQALLGYYFGYLIRRNGWSLSESIFQHFWWDAILFTGGFLTQRRVPAAIQISLPLPL